MSLLRIVNTASFTVFQFKDPDTQHLHRGRDFKSLLENIRLYRAQNELDPLEFLEAVVEHALCKMPCHTAMCEKRPPLKRGIIPFLKGGLLLLKNLAYNQFVTQEIADARAAVCCACPLNVFPDKTKFVTWSDELAVATVGDRRASRHDELGTCDACGCPLRCKVWYGGKTELRKPERLQIEKVKPECWQLEKV